MKKIVLESAPTQFGTTYPAPYDGPCRGRRRWRLGDAAGLTQFGVNLLRLPAGAWSSQRHWHSREDELIYVLEGEVVMITDGGEEMLRAGDCAGFPAGESDGHHLQNRSAREAVILEIGTRRPDSSSYYPDIDLELRDKSRGYVHKDGTPYKPEDREKP
jgi:uncharacterized cupin superfamily protein